MMRVGISIGSNVVGNGPEAERDGPRFVLEQARAAARAGLDSLTLGDHHATGPVRYVQNVPMLGRILAEWRERQAGCLFLLPLWHPVLMAEQVGTLATMAAGPFIVQVGAGGEEGQFRAMGVRLDDRGTRLEDGIRLVRSLLSGETVTSDTYNLSSACVVPLPPQGTEWWVGGGVRKATARRPPRRLLVRERRPHFGVRQARHAHLPGCLHRPRPGAGADPHPQGRVRFGVPCGRRAGGRWARESGIPGFRPGSRRLYGDPESVAEQLAPFADLGFTDAIIRTMWPLPSGFDAAAAHRSVELAGEVRALLSE